MEEINVSVIVSISKDRGFLDECLYSIKNNGFSGNSEIILAVTGNEKLIEYANKHKIEYVYTKGNVNLATNLNNAIKKARGKYIKIFADDDILMKGILQKMFDKMELNNLDVIYSDFINLYKDGTKKDYIIPINNDLKTLILNKKIPGGTTMYKLSSFKAVNGYDEVFNIAEGYILNIKLINAGFDKFEYLNEFSAYYRHHSEQKSVNLNEDKTTEREKEMKEIIKKYNFDIKTSYNRKKIALITCMYGRDELTDKIFNYYNNIKKELLSEIELLLIVAGSEGEKSKKIAEENEWIYIETLNEPLNNKFESVLQKAKEFNPDAVVVIGSDDIISKNIFNIYKETKAKVLGFLDCYIYSTEINELIYWGGYEIANRINESVGAGRYFSKEILNKLDWHLWDNGKEYNRSLDLLCNNKLINYNIKIKLLKLKDINGFIIDIKGPDKINLTHFNVIKAESIIINNTNINTFINNFMKNTKIENCYVSNVVSFFGDKFCKKWNLKNSINKNKPLIIFGCYGSEEIDIALTHSLENSVIIIWTGSDSMREYCTKSLINEENIYHISGSDWISKDLKSAGLKYKYIPVSICDHTELSAKPLGQYIYIYTGANIDFYGKKIYDRLIEFFGEKYFIIANAKTFTKEELYKIYEKCFIGLRLVEHDGLSETVCELGLMGRNVIYNGDTPNSLSYNSYEDIVTHIENERKKIGYVDTKLHNEMQEFLNIGDEWLYSDFYLDSIDKPEKSNVIFKKVVKNKLGVAYSVFDDLDHLRTSLRSIRNNVDFITVIYQNTSYTGNLALFNIYSKLKDLVDDKLIDSLQEYKPNPYLSAKHNEVNKRNLGLRICTNNYCTHHITMDSDEIFKPEQFKKAKEIIFDYGYEASFVFSKTYYKDQKHIVTPDEKYHMPFIYKSKGRVFRYDENIESIMADRSRKMTNVKSDIMIFEREFIEMHHLSYIRENMERKLRNKASGLSEEKIASIINDYNNFKRFSIIPQPVHTENGIMKVKRLLMSPI